jgi:predicted O-methyltransferase YrrM
MQDRLQTLMAELERFGAENDRTATGRARCMLNITRDTGELLGVVVRATAARRVLEIGTSNGYSTLWLADAARAVGGHVTTVELSDYKVELARQTFTRSGLAACVTQLHDDAARVLRRMETAAFDLVFLDSDRRQYVDWWPDLKRVLRPGGLLVVDNATSHAAEMAPFARLLTADAELVTVLLPMGNGELLAVKATASAVG